MQHISAPLQQDGFNVSVLDSHPCMTLETVCGLQAPVAKVLKYAVLVGGLSQVL